MWKGSSCKAMAVIAGSPFSVSWLHSGDPTRLMEGRRDGGSRIVASERLPLQGLRHHPKAPSPGSQPPCSCLLNRSESGCRTALRPGWTSLHSPGAPVRICQRCSEPSTHLCAWPLMQLQSQLHRSGSLVTSTNGDQKPARTGSASL